jgi:hypothetical protein
MRLTRRVLTTTSLALGLVFLQGGVLAQADFRRGDANVDGVVDLSDVAFLIDFFAGSGRDGPCHDAMDANDDGILDPSDVFDLHFSLLQGFSLPDPGTQTPGPDPGADDLTCAEYRPAQPPRLAEVALGFECPAVLTGAPGERVRFVAFATLTVSGDATELGPAGWSFGLGSDGLRIVEATTQGTLAQFFPSETQLIDPEIDPSQGPQWTGVVSAVLLYQDLSTRVALPWNGTHSILRLTLETTVPQEGAGAARLFFAEGLGRGQPMRNVVIFDGTSQLPGPSGLGSCEIPIRIAACNLDPVPDEGAAPAPWEEGFDAYPCGSDVIGQGEWEGWAFNPDVGADIDCSTALSEPAALALRADSDVVHRFDVAGGLWSLRTQVLIPSDHAGATWFILLNQYQPEYGLFNWSTDVSFSGGGVTSHGGTGFFSNVGRSLPVIPDTWAELRIDIDLDRNLQTIIYDGQVLHETVWQHNGLGRLSAVDLYSQESAATFDDLRLEPGTEASDCNANCVPDSLDLAGPARFAAPVFYESGTAVAAADLDGDGSLDLTSFGASSAVAVLFNDGRGTFGGRQVIAGTANVLVAADFDGGHGVDLIAGGFLEVPLTVLRNRGDGRFVPDEGIALPGGGIVPCPELAECGPALDAAAADLDGDGDIDLALAASFGNVWFFENVGGASFQLAGALLEPARRVRIGDLDGDGSADLVTANSDRQRSLALFRNEGAWAFAEASVLGLGEIVRDLVLADLDGDKDLEIAGVSGGDPEQEEPALATVFVFKQTGGSFEPEIFPAGSIVEAIDAADLDGDGAVDLAVAGGPWHAWVLRNMGGGAFGRPMPLLTGDGPVDLVAAELTGDGKPDLAVTHDGSRELALFANATESTASDCNRNGRLDECDIAAGSSLDGNSDGVPDECGRNQLPGDCNQDARTDIADPVCLLGHLFLGNPGVLPCEEVGAAPGRLALMDFNGDRLINISDSIVFLGWLFLPSFPPHVLGEECVAIEGCPQVPGCVTDR